MITRMVAMNIQAVSPLFGVGAAGAAAAGAGTAAATGAAEGAAAGASAAVGDATGTVVTAVDGAGLGASWALALKAPHMATATAIPDSHLAIFLFIWIPLKVLRCRSRR